MKTESCQNTAVCISMYLDGEFASDDERRQFEEYLKQYVNCRQKLQELKQTDDTIKNIFSHNLPELLFLDATNGSAHFLLGSVI